MVQLFALMVKSHFESICVEERFSYWLNRKILLEEMHKRKGVNVNEMVFV